MTCSHCNGTGKEKCIVCDGGGRVVNMVGGSITTSSWSTSCHECSGTGRMTCRLCKGTGEVQSKPQQQRGQACRKCRGTGKVRCSSRLCKGSGYYMGPYGMLICTMCGGKGKVKCDDCKGMGRY